MSIHAFLTGDEWFIWLVKGRREQRMPIKLEKHLFRMMASWEEAGSSSTLLPFFFFVSYRCPQEGSHGKQRVSQAEKSDLIGKNE